MTLQPNQKPVAMVEGKVNDSGDVPVETELVPNGFEFELTIPHDADISTNSVEVELYGGDSYDPEDCDITFEWRDSNGDIIGSDQTITFNLEEGQYEYSFVVIDSDGEPSNVKDVTVIVNPEDNIAPIIEIVSLLDIEEPLPWEDEIIHCIFNDIFITDSDVHYITLLSDEVNTSIIYSDLELDEDGCFSVPYFYSDSSNEYEITIQVTDWIDSSETTLSYVINQNNQNSQRIYQFDAEGKNHLLAFPFLPYNESETTILDANHMEIPIVNFMESNISNDDVEARLSSIMTNGSAAISLNSVWAGSLVNINQKKGYWIKTIDGDSSFDFTYDGYSIDESIEYTIEAGTLVDLLSFPCPFNVDINEVLGNYAGNEIMSIMGEGVAATYVGDKFVGNLSDLNNQQGYWVVKNTSYKEEEISFSWECNYDAVTRIDENLNVETPNEISFDQSMQQSFYFIESIQSNNQMIDVSGNQWIVSYCGDNIAGSRYWNGSIVDVPVMGFDGSDNTDGLCEFGDTPEFKLYDSSTGDYLDLYLSETPEWVSNEIYIVGNASISESLLPGEFELSSVHPNPFNPTTNIEFVVPDNMHISVAIFDISGREINRLQDGIMESGYHSISWNASYVSSGVYFLKIVAGNEIYSRKLMLVK